MIYMNKFRRISFTGLAVCMMACCPMTLLASVPDVQPSDTVYVYLSAERLDVYPPQYIQDYQETGRRVILTTTDGVEHRYRTSLIDSVSNCAPDSLPRLASFKFNNKFNDQVFTDVIADIEGDSLITASVGAIGKYLTPSFQLYDSLACVYVDGVRQQSKHTRRDFREPLNYTVARPGWQVIGPASSADDNGGDDDDPGIDDPSDTSGTEVVTQVTLTADMLSTNAPSNYPGTEDLDKLLDGDLYTIFHSTWGTGAYEKLPIDESPYIDVALPEALHRLQFSYTTRNSAGRHPLSLRLYASHDGNAWKAVRDFTVEDDGLPTGTLETYRSPTVDLGGDYEYLRVEQTACAYKNYLAWAEFSLYRVTLVEPEEPAPDPDPEPTPEPVETESLQWTPYGRTYRVSIDWPTDRAVMTPTIYIDIENGAMVSSKEYYLEATISIDGAGVFPDMEETPVQIKGRGNSSWNAYNAYDKNPYRLKFSTKQKPFGLTKGKSWVLQANKQTGSMMVNGIGMKAAHLMGAVAANHVVPVELYMNGEYRGSYIFNEKLGFSNNSIDLEDESAATFIELDTYSETGQFRTTYYYMPVNIKEPDFSDETTVTQLTRDDIVTDMNAFMKAVFNSENISSWVDVDYLASFLSVNELVGNYELMHPKSTFLYKENLFGDSKYIFGPVWDLDWAYGYEGNSRYCTYGATDNFYSSPAHTFSGGSNANRAEDFWKNLRYSDEAVDRAYYKLWTKFMTQGGIDELLAFCDDYYEYANPSFLHNAQKWNDGYNYSTNRTNAKSWLQRRAQYIYSKLTPYDLTGELDEVETWSPTAAERDNDDPEDDVAVERVTAEPTRFRVYDLRGILLKGNATFNTWRDGLAPGIYIVNGKKVLVQ